MLFGVSYSILNIAFLRALFLPVGAMALAVFLQKHSREIQSRKEPTFETRVPIA